LESSSLNRLDRKLSPAALNEKWVTDITYLPVNGSFVYLSAIQDLYNNEIIAYHVSKRNDLSLVMKTLEKACENKVVGTLIHSDQDTSTLLGSIARNLSN
jgi:transposase InsO family protein